MSVKSFDANAQVVERVHRLTSKLDVTVYCLITRGTIDEKVYQVWRDKGDASCLAIDGRLFEDDDQSIDLFELLEDAHNTFDAEAETIDEGALQVQWEAELAPRLRSAQQAYRRARHGSATAELVKQLDTIAPTAAVEDLTAPEPATPQKTPARQPATGAALAALFDNIAA